MNLEVRRPTREDALKGAAHLLEPFADFPFLDRAKDLAAAVAAVLSLVARHAIAGCVPIPNRLFDEVLPTLTDTELRLILVVMRATLGWREGSDSGGWRYKRRDWLTHRQLVRRTGRSSASISSAIQSLVVAGLIRVEDAGAVA